MPERTDHQRSVPVSLPPDEQWTLHHVLLDRIEQEATAEDLTSTDPPAVEIFQAFDRLDAGRTRFTVDQLEAMQPILADYHHRTSWWEIERSQVESLLRRITDHIEQHHPISPANR